MDIARLSDLEEIRQLTYRYSRGVDSFDRDLILSVFIPDAELDHTPFGFSASKGHDELRTYFEQLHQLATNLTDIITNHLIDFADDNTATGRNYGHAEMRTSDGRSLKELGFNEDVYVRTSESSRIKERVTVPLLPPEPPPAA